MLDRALARGLTIGLVVLVAALAFGAFGYMRGRLIESIYQRKLELLAAEYGALRKRYNRAVEDTAVTELVVHPDEGGGPGRVDVIVRSVEGTLDTVETGFEADAEIHVDFVIRAGRLFIRRVYDDRTAPVEGTLIDPELSGVVWNDPEVARGLTVYRGDLQPGRWVVSTTGNGALDLEPAPVGESIELFRAPPVLDFEVLRSEVEDEIGDVSVSDVVREAWGVARSSQ